VPLSLCAFPVGTKCADKILSRPVYTGCSRKLPADTKARHVAETGRYCGRATVDRQRADPFRDGYGTVNEKMFDKQAMVQKAVLGKG
jgi:hypothetical protein